MMIRLLILCSRGVWPLPWALLLSSLITRVIVDRGSHPKCRQRYSRGSQMASRWCLYAVYVPLGCSFLDVFNETYFPREIRTAGLVLHSREFSCICVCVCGVAQALPRCSRVSSYGLHPLEGMKVCRALN